MKLGISGGGETGELLGGGVLWNLRAGFCACIPFQFICDATRGFTVDFTGECSHVSLVDMVVRSTLVCTLGFTVRFFFRGLPGAGPWDLPWRLL